MTSVPWKSHAKTHWQRDYAARVLGPEAHAIQMRQEPVAACHVHKRPSTGFPVSRLREYVTCKACLYQIAMHDGVKSLRKRRNPMCPKCRAPQTKNRSATSGDVCAICLMPAEAA